MPGAGGGAMIQWLKTVALKRTQIQFPALTGQLTTVCNWDERYVPPGPAFSYFCTVCAWCKGAPTFEDGVE